MCTRVTASVTATRTNSNVVIIKMIVFHNRNNRSKKNKKELQASWAKQS